MKRHLVVVGVIVLVLATGIAAAGPRGSPELSVYLPDDRVTPGEETELGVFILNGGSIAFGGSPDDERRVTTARNVRMTLEETGVLDIKTATRPVGNVPEGTVGPVLYSVSVADDAAPGTYRIPVEVKYKYTHQIASGDQLVPNHQETQITVTKYITLEVEAAPRFHVSNTELQTFLDDTGTIEITASNTGEDTAYDARFSLTSEAPQLSFAGSQTARTFVGAWAPNETRTFSFDVQVAEEADRRPFPVSVDVAYNNDDGQPRESETLRIGVIPAERTSRFTVEETTADLGVGDTGSLEVVLRNAGGQPVRDARLSLVSNDPKLTFAGAQSAESLLGSWEANEVKRVTFKATVADGADVRPYSLSATVRYKDPDGDTRSADPLIMGVRPRPEQTFSVENVRSSLAAGEEGTLEGQVVNTGEVTARNAVVVFQTDDQTVSPTDTEYAVGNLEPGESSPFSFDIEISDAAGGGPRQFAIEVRYRNADDDIRRSDTIDLQVDVADEQQVFRVEPLNTTVGTGGSTNMALRLTNAGNESLSDISAKLFTSDPLSTTNDEAFVSRLAPGESTTLVFGVSAAGGAIPKAYPISLDFQYDDEDGDTLLSDTYRVPVEVTSGQRGGGLPLLPIIVVVLVIAAGGFYWYRRRQG